MHLNREYINQTIIQLMRKNNEMILLIQGYIEDHKFRSFEMNHIVFNGKKKKTIKFPRIWL